MQDNINPATRMIGLFGCGLWGRNILRDLKLLGAQVLVVDPQADARALALNLGARLALAEPWQQSVRGWIVAAPASQHLACIRAIAHQGVPILCEKPLAHSVEHGEQILAVVHAAQATCHVLDVWRYHPAVQWLRDAHRLQTLGETPGLTSLRANWTSPRQDIDTLANFGPHEISIYREIFAREPDALSASADWHGDQTRSVWLRLGRAPWQMSTLSNRCERRVRELRLHGSEGIAVFNADQPAQIWLARGPSTAQLAASEMTRIELDNSTSPLMAQLSAWLQFLDGGAPPLTDINAGFRTLKLLQKFRELAAER